MQNDCQQFQESLRSNAGRIGPDGPGEHVRSCPDCQALVEALASPAVRALHALPHLSAPAALDGMVETTCCMLHVACTDVVLM